MIDRREFDLVDRDTGEPNIPEMKRFGKTIRAATGGRDPDIVFEHVGAATFPTSVFVCKTFGKVVICGATSGFSLNFDVRYLWMRQKSIIGSHFANAYQATRANQLIIERKVMPVLMRTFPFAECPVPHQMMRENAHLGKMVVLVGAAEPGLGVTGRAAMTARLDEPDRPWIFRTYAGHTTVARVERAVPGEPRRAARPGLSIAFDLPTQCGYDLRRSDRARRRSARSACRSNSLDDMHVLFDGIPLDQMNTSMTINAHRDVAARAVRRAGARARRARSRSCAARRRTTSSRSTSRAARTSSRPSRRST